MALPIPGRSYYLVPQCAPDLCVGLKIWPVEAEYAVALLQPRWGVPFQCWIARATGDAATSGYGFELYVNHIYKTVLTFPHQLRTCIFALAGREGLHGLLNGTVNMPKSDAPEDSPPALQLWNVLPNGDFFALQNAGNTDENLNVAGDGPYPEGTEILAWSWSGGRPNELWKFVEFSCARLVALSLTSANARRVWWT